LRTEPPAPLLCRPLGVLLQTSLLRYAAPAAVADAPRLLSRSQASSASCACVCARACVCVMTAFEHNPRTHVRCPVVRVCTPRAAFACGAMRCSHKASCRIRPAATPRVWHTIRHAAVTRVLRKHAFAHVRRLIWRIVLRQQQAWRAAMARGSGGTRKGTVRRWRWCVTAWIMRAMRNALACHVSDGCTRKRQDKIARCQKKRYGLANRTPRGPPWRPRCTRTRPPAAA
jgi:hypothetical protein